MKKLILGFLLGIFASFSLAGTTYYLNEGDYGYGIEVFNDDVLIVEGGGADVIDMRNFSRLEVRSTSSPLGLDEGGIFDIRLFNNSHLDYLGGLNELITIGSIATADLEGGSINHIKSMQYTTTLGIDPHINLYCQDGWSWISGNPLLGIEGLWLDGSPFYIDFINDEDYDPVWTNINITPEPTTLVLFGMGGLLIRRKKMLFSLVFRSLFKNQSMNFHIETPSMKVTVVILLCMSISVSLADYTDGYITVGEYEGHVVWTSSIQPLIVEGGGATWIDVGIFGRLEVRFTSTPINDDWHTGGITDIWLGGHLDYFGGITEEITIVANATADLYGGRIDAITSMQYTTTTGAGPHIDLYAQPGWEWIYSEEVGMEDKIIGITGVWGNGGNTPLEPFTIELINDEDYDPVWTNINVIVPEPATLTLLAFGGLLLQRKR